MEYIFNMFNILLAVSLICLTVKGELEIYASPDRVMEGGAIDIRCQPRNGKTENQMLPESGATDDLAASPATPGEKNEDGIAKCHFRWTRSRTSDRRMSESGQVGTAHGPPLYFYTSRDQDERPVQSTVAIEQMSHDLEGIYTCFMDCPGRLESASLRLKLGETDTFLGDRGAVVATIVAFVLIGVGLVAVGVALFKDRCRRPRSAESAQSLMTSEQSRDDAYREFSDPPPRYSVVVVATSSSATSGVVSVSPQDKLQYHLGDAGVDALRRSGSVQSLYVLPPDYEQALLDLAKKGVHFNTNDLGPMPPAYMETYQKEQQQPAGSNDHVQGGPAVLRLNSVELV